MLSYIFQFDKKFPFHTWVLDQMCTKIYAIGVRQSYECNLVAITGIDHCETIAIRVRVKHYPTMSVNESVCGGDRNFDTRIRSTCP